MNPANPSMASGVELLRSTETFPCPDGFMMNAYLSRPRTAGPVPGLLFIFEAFGMNQEMTRIADELATAGYVVMLPDLFQRGSWFSCIRKLMRDLKTGAGRGVEDLMAARKWLGQQAYVEPEKIAVMGLCMGGGFALLLGKTGLFRVSAPFYGQVPEKLDGICPVVASYGGRDKWLLKDVARLEKELPALGVAHDVKVYAGAGHSFMNGPPNLFVGSLSRAMKFGYEPVAAADAMRRVTEFLKAHL